MCKAFFFFSEQSDIETRFRLEFARMYSVYCVCLTGTPFLSKVLYTIKFILCEQSMSVCTSYPGDLQLPACFVLHSLINTPEECPDLMIRHQKHASNYSLNYPSGMLNPSNCSCFPVWQILPQPCTPSHIISHRNAF